MERVLDDLSFTACDRNIQPETWPLPKLAEAVYCPR